MPTADVKLVCGACGHALDPGVRVCGSCGSDLRYPVLRPSGETRCPACGYAQSGEGEVCESCGAPLRPREKREGAKQRPRPSGARKSNSGAKRGTEPWMVVAGISILLLLAYIVYSAVTAPPAPAPGASPVVGPAQPPMAGQRMDLQPLEDAVKRSPKDPAALLQLANALHDGGVWERSAETYERYLAVNPGNPDARVDMAICYFELSKANAANREKNYARAVAEMNRVMKEHPRHQAAAFNLGVVTLHSGDVTGANVWFKRAAEIDPASPLGQRASSIMQQHSFTN